MIDALLLGSAIDGGINSAKTYIDDVFSTTTYTGNGGSPRTVNNGLDFVAKGGLVWFKDRSNTNFHVLQDTVRGAGKSLFTQSTTGQVTQADVITTFNTSGFTTGGNGNIEQSTASVVSWAFRRAPMFFDIVTWVGDGTTKVLNHALGKSPGMIIIKSIIGGSNADWYTYHRGLNDNSGNPNFLFLNSAAAQDTGGGIFGTPTTSTFTVMASGNVNGQTYIAYLFGHDTTADGLIQCGSFVTDISGNFPAINLGWEPQFMLCKDADSTGDWRIFDTARGWTTEPGSNRAIQPNTTIAEYGNQALLSLAANGFSASSNVALRKYIYLAIRRSNKPPTSGTQVYNAVARTGTGAATTITGVGFAPDMMWVKKRSGTTQALAWDRLRGPTKQLILPTAAAETTSTVQVISFDIDGVSLGTDSGYDQINGTATDTFINYFFKRAASVFDIVCYIGTGLGSQVLHGLGVLPEFMIWRSRSSSQRWDVWHKDLGTYSGQAHKGLVLNTAEASQNSGVVTTSGLTSTFWLAPAGGETNTSGVTQVMYLFASKSGISKVGSYTGNGASQNIDCGFSAGARFILVKRTDAAGDWYVWDAVRGIVAANDPHLSLNTPTAEITTDDSVDPYAAGFSVNQLAATNVNVSAATYIFLAIA